MTLDEIKTNCLNECILTLKTAIEDFVVEQSRDIDLEILNNVAFEAPLYLFIFFCRVADMSYEDFREKIIDDEKLRRLYDMIGNSIIDAD